MSFNNYKYVCEPCKYRTNVRQYFYAHNKTKKHYRKTQMLPRYKLDNWKCPNCKYSFKHKSSLKRHKNKCDETIINNIKNQNVTNINKNVTNIDKSVTNVDKSVTNIDKSVTNVDKLVTNHNTINITLSINSPEEAEKIKEMLTAEKFKEICYSEDVESSDILKRIQNFSLNTKKNTKELQNFKKQNMKDNIIDILENNIFKKVYFNEYNREDLHKFAKHLMDKCENIEPNKSYEEKLELICDVLKDYEYYKNKKEITSGTIKFIMKSIDECEKLSKIEHYNITQH